MDSTLRIKENTPPPHNNTTGYHQIEISSFRSLNGLQPASDYQPRRKRSYSKLQTSKLRQTETVLAKPNVFFRFTDQSRIIGETITIYLSTNVCLNDLEVYLIGCKKREAQNRRS